MMSPRIHSFGPLALTAGLLFATACASSAAPTGTNTNTGSTAPTNTPSGGSSLFSGTFTAAAALFEGGSNGLDQNQLVINLLSAPMDCPTWQNPNAPIASQSYDLQLVLNGAAAGSYTLLDPNSADAQNQLSGTGTAVDAYFNNGESGVTAMSGSTSITSFTPGQSVGGSMTITWDDGETMTVAPFTANYCADTNTWGGAFVPQAAYFTQDGNSTGILLLSQPMSCADWLDPNVPIPLGTTIWEIVIGGTTAGTYTLASPTTAAPQAFAYQTYSNATVTSTQGSVTLSNVSSAAATVAVPSVAWSNDANSTVAAFSASFCNF